MKKLLACLALAASLWFTRPHAADACNRMQALVLDSTDDVDRAFGHAVCLQSSGMGDDAGFAAVFQTDDQRDQLALLPGKLAIIGSHQPVHRRCF